MDIQNLETQYLKAKIAYYDGNPIMSDAAFDVLEQELKAAAINPATHNHRHFGGSLFVNVLWCYGGISF